MKLQMVLFCTIAELPLVLHGVQQIRTRKIRSVTLGVATVSSLVHESRYLVREPKELVGSGVIYRMMAAPAGIIRHKNGCSPSHALNGMTAFTGTRYTHYL